MPKQGSQVHPEHIVHLMDAPDATNQRPDEHDDPSKDVRKVHAGKDVNERLGRIVIDKYHPPARQYAPGIHLDDEKPGAQ